MNTMLTLAAITLGGSSLLSLLLWLLLVAALVYVAFLILGMFPLPAPVKQIITVILAVVFLIVLLQHLGIAL